MLCTCLLSIICSLFYIQDGATALLTASENGHTSVVDILLRHGANPNLADHVSIEVV